MTCMECGTELAARQTRHCSKRCYMTTYHREYRERHGELQSTLHRRQHGRDDRKHEVTCEWCSRTAMVTSTRVRCCSIECAMAKRSADALAASAERARERSLPVRRLTRDPHLTLRWREAESRLAVSAAGPRRGNAVYVGGTCRRCGTAFVVMLTNTSPTYCSRRCLRSNSKERRRAAQKGAFVEAVSRIAIFTRDRWTCRLCGRRVRRDAVVPDSMAPVLDHIVPLAAGVELGGVHAPHNVQTAHFLCNSIKSDRLTQPALF